MLPPVTDIMNVLTIKNVLNLSVFIFVPVLDIL